MKKKEREFWEERLDDMFEKFVRNPNKYKWKLMHLIVTKYEFPIPVRGNSLLESALKVIRHEKYKDLNKREKNFIEKVVGELG